MPAYMNGKTGSWYVQCYYSDIDGNRKHKVKRGFATRDEALTWEAEFLASADGEAERHRPSRTDNEYDHSEDERHDKRRPGARHARMHVNPDDSGGYRGNGATAAVRHDTHGGDPHDEHARHHEQQGEDAEGDEVPGAEAPALFPFRFN